MSGSLSLPKISTNVRFAASALLFPELAAAWAERLFLTPPPASREAGGAAALDLIEARATLIEHRGRQIAAWRWGERDAPAVILAHGWGGYAAQMRAFVFPLLSAGYRVIAYDQRAHSPRPRASCASSARSSSARPRISSATHGASHAGTGCRKRCAAPCKRRSKSATACCGTTSRCRASPIASPHRRSSSTTATIAVCH